MTSRFFGQYLLEKGVIGRDALLAAINRQRQTNRDFSELAIAKGYLEKRRAPSLLMAFRASDRSIDEIAVDGGYVTQQQADEVLKTQKESRIRIGTTLVEAGHLSEEQVKIRLAEFHAQENQVQQQLQADFEGFAETGTLKACFNLTAFHFSRLAGGVTKLGLVEEDQAEVAAGFQRFAQKIVGDKVFCLAVDFPPELVEMVSTQMLGMAMEPGSEAATDAVCEFVNLVGGNACTQLERLGYRLRPEPPFSSPHRGDYPGKKSFRAGLLTEDTGFDVHVFF